MERAEVSTFDAEVAVIGSLLIDPSSYKRVAGIVSAGSFQSEVYGEIFVAAAALSREGKPIDPFTVREWLDAHNGGRDIPDTTLAQVMDLTPTSANDTAYARIVADHAKRRALCSVARSIMEDSTTETDTLLSAVSASVERLLHSSVSDKPLSSFEQMERFQQALETHEMGVSNFVPGRYGKLDAVLGGGFLRGGLYILAARPGMGKTTVALNIAEQVKGAVLFVSLEMSREQITAKRIACASGLPSHRVLSGCGLNEDEYERIAKASVALCNSGVSVACGAGVTVSKIGIMARCIKGLSLVIVDYLGLIQPENRRASRYEAITDISGALKRLAMSLNVPVLALAQMNRANEARTNKRPQLSDLRDSGAVEQDADGVLLLYRDDYYERERDKKLWEPSLLECHIAKNRHAAAGLVRFNAYLGTCCITEV